MSETKKPEAPAKPKPRYVHIDPEDGYFPGTKKKIRHPDTGKSPSRVVHDTLTDQVTIDW